MYLYRMLTDADITLQPKENGIFNKRIIEDSMWPYLEKLDDKLDYTILYELAYNNSPEYAKYCLSAIKKATQLESIDSKEIANSIKDHIYKEKSVNTKWLTFSKDIKNALDGYNKTTIHQVALIDSNISKNYDDGVLAIDLSSDKSIKQNKLLKHDEISLQLYDYSKNKEEVLYYNHIPANRIRVLDSIIIDMLCNDMLDTSILDNPSAITRYVLGSLALVTEELASDSLTEYLITEIYINNRNISSLVDSNISYEKLLEFKKNILLLISKQENRYTKKLNHDIILPEEFDRHR